MYDAPLTSAKAFNPLAQQLQVVARMIDASAATGIGACRQVFFVSMGGFDSHDNENRNNADLMAKLAHAMRYFDSSPDQIGNGSLIPETSVDQLGATLARWFGVSDSDALTVFPNLANFDISKRNLGFMMA